MADLLPPRLDFVKVTLQNGATAECNPNHVSLSSDLQTFVFQPDMSLLFRAEEVVKIESQSFVIEIRDKRKASRIMIA